MAMAEGAFILVAGALLLTPGFITDCIGFCCLLPPLRQSLIRRMLFRFGRPEMRPGPAAGRVIDAEFTRHEDRD